MSETKKLSVATSSTGPSPKAMLALGRAFNKVGDARNLPTFKEAGRGLMVAAQKASFSTPQIGDQRRAKPSKGPAINPAPIK